MLKLISICFSSVVPKGNCSCVSRLVDTRRQSWNYNRKWGDEFHYCLQRVQLKKNPAARKKLWLRSLNCNSVKDMNIVSPFNKYRILQSLSHTRSRKWMQYFGRKANVYILWKFACSHKMIPQYRLHNGICTIHVNNTGWSKSLCAPDNYSTIIRCTETFWSLYNAI